MRRHLAVVGHPIAHSQSPTLHRAAYNVLQLPWDYEAVDLEPGGLTAFVRALDESWLGLSVTMPHKVEALQLADSVDAIARMTGSVNTLVLQVNDKGNRVVSGFNTDVAGMVGALSRAGIDRAHEVAIVGGGATASSALVAAAQLGAERVTVLVRDVERAQRLVQVGEAAGIAVRIHDVQNPESLAPVDLVISTLPGGAELSLATLPRVSSAILLDVAYSPWPSLRGAEWSSTTPGTPIVVSGLSMLADQALVQVRLFHSGDALVSLPDEEAVRHAMYAAVNLI